MSRLRKDQLNKTYECLARSGHPLEEEGPDPSRIFVSGGHAHESLIAHYEAQIIRDPLSEFHSNVSRNVQVKQGKGGNPNYKQSQESSHHLKAANKRKERMLLRN